MEKFSGFYKIPKEKLRFFPKNTIFKPMELLIASLLRQMAGKNLLRIIRAGFFFFLKSFFSTRTFGKVLGILLFCCFSFSGLATEDEEEDAGLDLWGDGVEITCENVLESFKTYQETITLTRQAFSKALRTETSFLQSDGKSQKEKEKLQKEFSEISALVQDNSESLAFKGSEIVRVLKDCSSGK